MPPPSFRFFRLFPFFPLYQYPKTMPPPFPFFPIISVSSVNKKTAATVGSDHSCCLQSIYRCENLLFIECLQTNNDFTHYSFIIPHYLVIPDVVRSANSFGKFLLRVFNFYSWLHLRTTYAILHQVKLYCLHPHRGHDILFLFHCLMIVSCSEFLVSTSYNLPSPPPFREGLGVGFLFHNNLFTVHDVDALLSLVHTLTREVVDLCIVN